MRTAAYMEDVASDHRRREKLASKFLLIYRTIVRYLKTLRGDAHCGAQGRCRKRPPQARETSKQVSIDI